MSDAIQRIREALAWSARAFGDHSDDIRALLDRLDAAVREIERLRAELADAYAEVHKQVAVSKVIFDRALVNRAKASLATPSEERKP